MKKRRTDEDYDTTKGIKIGNQFPVKTTHLCNIYAMLEQHRRRWGNVV